MAGSDPKTAPDPALVELGRAMSGLGRKAGDPPLGSEVVLDPPQDAELALADLMSDANGEIVFFNDSGFRTLTITTDATVVAGGHAAPHVTAAGADVTGLHFVTFDNGLTLYFQEGLDLILHPPA